MNENRLHIAFSFDQHYTNQAFTFLESVIDNHQIPITFHSIIDSGVSEKVKPQLEKRIQKAGHELKTYEISGELVKQYVTSGTWSHAVYYKLFFPVVLDPSIQKFVFLDVDAVVLKPLTELFAMDLSDFPLAAVYDNYVKIQPLIGITAENVYFNSGMMLINTTTWNREQITEKAIAYLNEHPENIRFVDQCALNAVIHGNYLKLDPAYNFTFTYVIQFREQLGWKHTRNYPYFVHFTLQRPWEFLCKNPFRTVYKHYFKRSSFTEGNVVQNFRWSDMTAFLKLRATEIYLNSRTLTGFWRKLKAKQ